MHMEQAKTNEERGREAMGVVASYTLIPRVSHCIQRMAALRAFPFIFAVFIPTAFVAAALVAGAGLHRRELSSTTLLPSNAKSLSCTRRASTAMRR